jgi:hypothetical protein
MDIKLIGGITPFGDESFFLVRVLWKPLSMGCSLNPAKNYIMRTWTGSKTKRVRGMTKRPGAYDHHFLTGHLGI